MYRYLRASLIRKRREGCVGDRYAILRCSCYSVVIQLDVSGLEFCIRRCDDLRRSPRRIILLLRWCVATLSQVSSRPGFARSFSRCLNGRLGL